MNDRMNAAFLCVFFYYFQGDASVCYAKAESVALAVQVLDGGRLRSDAPQALSVQKAQFTAKTDFDASKRQKVRQ